MHIESEMSYYSMDMNMASQITTDTLNLSDDSMLVDMSGVPLNIADESLNMPDSRKTKRRSGAAMYKCSYKPEWTKHWPYIISSEKVS